MTAAIIAMGFMTTDLIELVHVRSDIDVEFNRIGLGRSGALFMSFLADLTSAILNFVAFQQSGTSGQWMGITK
jgi:hypothetical protein